MSQILTLSNHYSVQGGALNRGLFFAVSGKISEIR
jgi:hypothetical protein